MGSQDSEDFNPMQAILTASGSDKPCRAIGLRRVAPLQLREQ